jgi:hypothetical protein
MADILRDKIRAAVDLAQHAERDHDLTKLGWVSVLQDLNLLAQTVASATDSAVRGAREAGLSWAEVAAPLGRTKQAAHERWGADPGVSAS